MFSKSWLLGSIAFASEDVMDLLQQFRRLNKAGVNEDAQGVFQQQELDPCVSWNMSQEVYGHSTDLNFYRVVRKYTINESGGAKDAAWLFKGGQDCTLTFQGTDTQEFASDHANNVNSTPIEKWGLTGVHAGVAAELEGLVDLMDFGEIRQACPGKFSVNGYSLGGALAQLFAVLLTTSHDPLNAQLQLHELHTIASYGALEGPAKNDQSDDGCFAGTQYWYAQKTEAGAYAVDTLFAEAVGAEVHDHVRGNKVFTVTEPGMATKYIKYPCGTRITGVDLFSSLGGLDSQAARVGFGNIHTGYGNWFECDSNNWAKRMVMERMMCKTKSKRMCKRMAKSMCKTKAKRMCKKMAQRMCKKMAKGMCNANDHIDQVAITY